MNETVSLLQNMSAPPKSVVKYSGLSSLKTPGSLGTPKGTTPKDAVMHQYGRAIRFSLPAELAGAAPEAILRYLGVAQDKLPHSSPASQLRSLINKRAAELPLPPGCAVIRSSEQHPVLWGDTLATLAILSKSTDTVWLRDKTPTLSPAVTRGAVSLLVPPDFVHLLDEVQG